MPSNLIPIKTFLGKYYPELSASVKQDKYINTELHTLFEQRFHIQTNKTQMIVDPSLEGLSIVVSGNEILVSRALYDHTGITVSNSMERAKDPSENLSLYNPEVFSTLSYLMCQNHTIFELVGRIDEPVYIKYKSDYEAFYSSVIVFNISTDVKVDIVEEFESHCALNSVTNYIIQDGASLNLTTFYKNDLSALSFCLRNVIAQLSTSYKHVLLGKGSSNIVDEHRIFIYEDADVNLYGCIIPNDSKFHSIIGVHPCSEEFRFTSDQRHILSGTGTATFLPQVVGKLPSEAKSDLTALDLSVIPHKEQLDRTVEFIAPIIEEATVKSVFGTERYFENKTKFLRNQ